MLEKTLESPLDSEEIKPVNPKGNQSWIFTERTDAESEAPILQPLIGKDSNCGKDWRQEEKGMTEDEMVGWYHRFNGHEFEQGPGIGDGQGSLACCSPWGHKELDMTERLNWTEKTINSNRYFSYFITFLSTSVQFSSVAPLHIEFLISVYTKCKSSSIQIYDSPLTVNSSLQNHCNFLPYNSPLPFSCSLAP